MTWIELIYSLPFILMGGCIFSFADVVADRLPRKISFVKGRSYCPSCGHTLSWYDMIPVVSWLLLRGKCRQCRCRIPARYPVTEAMGMAVAELSLLCFGGWNGYWHEINLCVLTVFSLLTLLLIIAQIDQQTMEIPNGLVIACIVPATMAVFAFPDVTLTERLIGFFSVSLPLFAITLAVPGAFGGGDIKLMAVIGFFLGWKMSLTAFMLAVFSGGIYGIGLLLSKKKGAKEHFAFGPFLCAGTALTLFVGEWLLSWYLSIIF